MGNTKQLSLRPIASAITLAAALLLPATSKAQQLPDPELLEASRRGIRYLVSQQDEKWGYFSDKKVDANAETLRPIRETNGLSGLAVMAILSNGNLPGEGTPESLAVERCIDFFLNPAVHEADGYYGKSDNSRMYGHGIVTLALAELVGLSPDAARDAAVRQRCQAAINVILESQKIPKDDRHRGGWRYNPTDKDSDLSASVWQVMALRAAKGTGMDIPNDAIASAVGYVKSCCALPKNAGPNWVPTAASFSYQSWNNNGPASTTAAGVLSLQVCGAYDSPEVKAGALRLLEDPPKWGHSWFYYGLYYYAQGMHQLGGEYEEASLDLLKTVVLPHQNPDGSWPPTSNEAGHGPIYSTSMALLALSVRHHYLPIYQR